MAVESTAKPPSSPLVQTKNLPDEFTPQSDSGEEDAAYPEQSKQLLTAIYRPESKTEWREKLRSANETAERVSPPISSCLTHGD
jgi:striatin 1/3/4